MSPKVYSYVRMSSAKQADGSSEERQAAPAKAYADAVGMELDDSHRDIGVSAGRGRHRKTGAMKAFLDKIESRAIVSGSILYIEAIDRMNREKFDDAYIMLSSILKAGVSIYDSEDEKLYTKQNINEPNVISGLVQKITSAHEFYKRLARRINTSKVKVLGQARTENRKLTKVAPGWLRLVGDLQHGQWVKIEDRVATVQQMFAMALDGIGTPTIAMRLNEAGAAQFTREAQGHKVKKAVGGNGWSASHVTQILTSRAVLGEHQPTTKRFVVVVNADGQEEEKTIVENNGPPIGDYYPIIIDKTTFDRVQAVRKNNVKGSNRNLKKPNTIINNLLSGKMVCKHCGGPMMLVTSSRRKKGYLFCQNYTRKKRGTCTAKGAFDYATLEQHLLRRMVDMDGAGLFRHSAPPSTVTTLQAEATRLAVALEAGEKALADWLGQPLSDRLRRLVAAKEAELDTMEGQLKAVTLQLEQASTVSLADQAGVVTRLQEAAEAGSVEARLKVRTALRSLITSVTVDVVGLTVNEGTGPKYAEIYCANDFAFIVYGHGATVDIETGGPAETMGRTFTIDRFTDHLF